MTVGIEAYRCAVGQFAPIFVTLLLKKVVKTSRKVHDSEVFTGEVCSGTVYCQQRFSSVRRFVFTWRCVGRFTLQSTVCMTVSFSFRTRIGMQTDLFTGQWCFGFLNNDSAANWPACLSPPTQPQISAVAVRRH